MEKYIITSQKKNEYKEKFSVLECEHAIGIDYDGYVSIKCKKLTGTCTYRVSSKNEYKNCRILDK